MKFVLRKKKEQEKMEKVLKSLKEIKYHDTKHEMTDFYDKFTLLKLFTGLQMANTIRHQSNISNYLTTQETKR